MTALARFPILVLIPVALASCGKSPPPPPPPPPPVAAAPAPPPAPVRPDWVRPDLDLKWLATDGQLQDPPNDGFDAPPVHSTLQPGRLIDQFGGPGRYFSPKGEPFPQRALPSICETQAYTVYRVLKPLPVASGKAVPWFDQPGGATVYEADERSDALIVEHVIEKLPNPGPAPCAAS
jgi:hypothetical protein